MFLDIEMTDRTRQGLQRQQQQQQQEAATFTAFNAHFGSPV